MISPLPTDFIESDLSSKHSPSPNQQKTDLNLFSDHPMNGNNANTVTEMINIDQSPTKQKEDGINDKKQSIPKDDKYNINDHVLLNKDRKGIIKFIGNVHFSKSIFYGIELLDGFIGSNVGVTDGSNVGK